jgi:ABC-type spermidine/putrescine transport system permease subunit II
MGSGVKELPDAPKRRIRSSGWSWAARGYATLFFSFLYVPILVLVALSFNDSPVTGFPLRGFTWGWYEEAFAGGVLLTALWNSMKIGFASALTGTLLALLVVLGMRARFRLRGAILPVLLIPIVMPGIVTGIVMLVFFGLMNWRYGLWPAAYIVHVTWVLPFAFLTLYPRAHKLDRSIEEAAMDLGATPLKVFQRIIFPLIRPGVVATFLFAFTLSFDEFIRTVFVSGSQRTMPVHLWVLVTEQAAPFLPAVGVIVMVLTLSVASLGFAVSSRTRTGSA